jgi:hypothetical protein
MDQNTDDASGGAGNGVPDGVLPANHEALGVTSEGPIRAWIVVGREG